MEGWPAHPTVLRSIGEKKKKEISCLRCVGGEEEKKKGHDFGKKKDVVRRAIEKEGGGSLDY